MHALRIKLLGAALVGATLTQVAWADSLPPSLVACAQLSDVLQRLACYDREVARFTRESPPLPAAAVVSPGTPAAAPPSAAVPATAATQPAQPTLRHVAARIVAIEGSADHQVLRLDNGQVWTQVERAEATLGLRIGDRVTIDRGLGDSFWLAGPSQAVMQVKLATS